MEENTNLDQNTSEDNVMYVVHEGPSVKNQLISAGIALVVPVTVGALTAGAFWLVDKGRNLNDRRKARKLQKQIDKDLASKAEDPTPEEATA